MKLNVLGTSQIKTSLANEEIIPFAPEEWTEDRYRLKQFSFINYTDCQVKINGSDAIFLEAEQGFDSPYGRDIYSFVIVTAGTQYSFVGVY